MPDRILRDELLTSERYWSVSIEAQRLFIHLILRVDNLSRFSGKNYTIRSACFPGQAVDPVRVESTLAELVDVDLIRLYHVDGERFVFIPRSRQRLRYRTSKYPTPPNGINDIATEKSDHSQTVVRPQSAEVKRSEVKRSEVKRREEDLVPVVSNIQEVKVVATNSEKRAVRGTRLNPDIFPTEDDKEFLRIERPDLNLQQTGERFIDYWAAIPGAKGVKLDWSATWRNWVRRS